MKLFTTPGLYQNNCLPFILSYNKTWEVFYSAYTQLPFSKVDSNIKSKKFALVSVILRIKLICLLCQMYIKKACVMRDGMTLIIV